MLNINDLEKGTTIILEGQPYEVLEARHLKMQQRRPVLQTKIKNLINGMVLERNFKQSDTFQEAEIERVKVKYIYNHRGEYFFSYETDSSKRFTLSQNSLGETKNWLKTNLIVEAIQLEGKIINIDLPIKVDYKVIEAPPSIKGDTAQGGVKTVTIETGAKINVPLFINQGDTIRINTETGEYVERVEKSK